MENCSLNWFKESFRVETVRDTYDRKRAENIMIPEEANYQRTMKRDVEPYLRSYEKDGYIESYDKTAIYYRTYRIPQAKKPELSSATDSVNLQRNIGK